MTAKTRLIICLAIIFVSGGYGILVSKSPQTASAISSGYVAILLTAIALVHFWRKP